MTSLNEIIQKLDELNEQNRLRTLYDSLKDLTITLDTVNEIYEKCISIRQSCVSKNGATFENAIAKFLEINNVHFYQQVAINKNGIIISYCSNECKEKDYKTDQTKTIDQTKIHIIDFIIVNDKSIDIIGYDVRDVIVLSTKKTVRERWAQDEWTLKIVPRKYILLTASNDYPNSDKFQESAFRKIITCSPKKKDDRMYKLNYSHIVDELADRYTFMDLFCGIGSFHYSFEQSFECVFASDINQAARDTYYANYHLRPLGDITQIDEKTLPRCDIICSGNPCQSFSNIGQRQGLKDTRGNLFYDVIRFAVHCQPSFIIFENVEGLAKHEDGNTLATMKTEIDRIGYDCQHVVLKCSDFGIPQMRKRVFILCAKKDLKINLDEMLSFEHIETPTLSAYLGRNFKKDIAYTIRCGGRRSPITDKHNWDGYYVDDKEYRLTVSDCLKLQGYRDSFILRGSETEQFQLLGNTIPTNLTKLMHNVILDYYTNPEKYSKGV